MLLVPLKTSESQPLRVLLPGVSVFHVSRPSALLMVRGWFMYSTGTAVFMCALFIYIHYECLCLRCLGVRRASRVFVGRSHSFLPTLLKS